MPAGGAVLNGAGEVHRVSPARRVGATRDAGLPHLDHAARPRLRRGVPDRARAEQRDGVDDVVIPVVGECDDSFLNDCRRMQVTTRTSRPPGAALASGGAATPPEEGAVGAGTGMSCLDFKGGIGTASRVIPGGHTVGVLLLTNFGVREECVVDGVPVGRLLPLATPGPRRRPAPASGWWSPTPRSTGVVRAAGPARRPRARAHRVGRPPRQRRDLPRSGPGLRSTARRRQASACHHRTRARPLFAAAVEAAEEAVLSLPARRPRRHRRRGTHDPRPAR